MKLGQRLRAARRHAGLSQKMLEVRSGVSQKTISKIERGDQESTTQVAQLARACNVRTDWLATDSGPMLAAPHELHAPAAHYETLSPEALEVGRIWSQLSEERRKCFRDLMAMDAIVTTHYPWLRFGHPRHESYPHYQSRIKQDFARLAEQLAKEK